MFASLTLRVASGFLIAPVLFAVMMLLSAPIFDYWHRGQWYLPLNCVSVTSLFLMMITYVYLLVPALIIAALVKSLLQQEWRFAVVRKICALLAAVVYAVVQVVAITSFGDAISSPLHDDAARSLLDRIRWPAHSSDHRISILAAMITLALAWWIIRARQQQPALPM